MSRNLKTFLNAILITVAGISLVLIGRSFAVKRDLQSNDVNTAIEQTPGIQSRPADEYFFVSSFKDLQEELELANDEKKTGVFVFFEMQGCPYCEYMKEKILNQLDVQDYYQQHFRSISIDIDAQTEAADADGNVMTEAGFASKYAVTLTPTMIFFGADGNELYRQIGFLKTKEQFLNMGKEIVEITSL